MSKQRSFRKRLLLLIPIGMLIFAFFSIQNVSGKTTSNFNQDRITFVFNPQNNKSLNHYVYQTVERNGKNFHHYFSPHQFANKFGQPNWVIKRLTNRLRRQHLKTKAYQGRLIVVATGNSKDIKRVINLNQRKKLMPRFASNKILGIVKSNQTNQFKSNYYQSKIDYGNGSKDSNLINAGPRRFINRYDVSPLYENNQLGRGQSIGIISFANFNPSDAYYYWNKQGIPAKSNRIKIINTSNKKPSWNQYDETTNDVEQSGSIAPDANIDVYMGDTTAQGMINALANAISANQTSSLSISWGQSERLVQSEIKSGQIPKYYNGIINLLFKQAAAQGMSIFTSAGDNGAYDAIDENYDPELSVDTPAASPYVTAVGGTTLPYRVSNTLSVNQERAWSNDFLYSIFDHRGLMNGSQSKFVQNYFAGTGGGFSKLNPIPPYQYHVKGTGTYNAIPLWLYKNKTLYRIAHPKLISGTSSGRNVPDISVNADPNTGYAAYYSNPGHFNSNGHWAYTGGTSIVAPQMAAVAALVNSKNNVRSGFWNPQIYQMATGNDSPFHPLDSIYNNNNLYYTGQKDAIYNQSTGLGTVDVAKLNHFFD
ncbi:aspartyl protease [Philodulcilactobacillus myokoensis]|uniref:Aspartyl protease n=1 Tax=Philodulcilactobacillus myokoensis TaxID=2929573 RepID=A0A9W6B1C1_9LACO|nr:S53 family peptidase [Philodulcilactobacillus myokoensis]GLB46726.1 aspartyl protease [Philodulcilactobacillus myokoensis]